MSLFVLTVSLSALGLPVVADNVVVVAKKRILTADAYPPIINLYEVKSLTNVSGIATASLDPDDATVYHEVEIYDLLGVKIYTRVFTMPPQAVALTALPVQDIITQSAAAAVAAAATSTEQAVISTAQAVISTAQAVIATTQAGIATTQAGLATTNGEAQVDLAEAQVALATAQAVIATDQAVLTAADRVQTALDRIQTGLDVIAAQAARDAAILSGNIFASTAAGHAGTADGEYFSIPSASATGYLDLYLHGGATDVFQDTYPSIAALAFVDQFTEMFAFGAMSIMSITDSTGLSLATWLADGILRAKFGLEVDSTSPITFTFSPSTGLTTVSLTTTALETAEQYIGANKVIGSLVDSARRAYLAMFEDGRTYIPKLLVDTIVSNGVITATAVTLSGIDLATMLAPETAEQYIGNNKVIGSLTDVNRRAYLAMFEDGKTYIPNITADTLIVNGSTFDPLTSLKPAADSANYIFQEETISSTQQIMRRTKSNGQITQITSTDDNYAPSISYDGANVIYTTTRTTPSSLYYQPVAGGTEYPYESTKLISAFGNSISTVGQGYVTALAALRPTETLSVQGVSGQRTDDIAYRTGATALTCSVTGASIPASGGVTVTGLNTTLFRRTTGTASVKATISGIAGVLSWASSVATFTRTSAGSITAVTNPVAVTITSGFVDGSTDPSAQPTLDTLLSGTAVMVLTYNDIKEATYSQSTTLANVAAIVARLKPLVKRLIIVGDCIGQGRLTAAQFPANPAPPADAATSELWITRSLALNAALLAAYPDNYLDMQGILITAGYSTVFNVNGTNYDVINLTVFPDGVHPTGGGATIFATNINNVFTSRGW